MRQYPGQNNKRRAHHRQHTPGIREDHIAQQEKVLVGVLEDPAEISNKRQETFNDKMGAEQKAGNNFNTQNYIKAGSEKFADFFQLADSFFVKDQKFAADEIYDHGHADGQDVGKQGV